MVHNPLADVVNMDVELATRFYEVFGQYGLCLVGFCDVENEAAWFDLLLTAESGLYI